MKYDLIIAGGGPAGLIEQNLELIKSDRPELYEKLRQKQFLKEPK